MLKQIPPITRNIIILNVLFYLASNLLFQGRLYDILSAFYPGSPNFHWWQIITHMFMHAPFAGGIGVMHILFNMFTLYSFGPILENTLGEKKYLWLYFLSGIGAFVLFNLWNFYQIQGITQDLEAMGVNVAEIYHKSLLGYSGNTNDIEANPKSLELYRMLATPMMGASGAVFGVVAAFATLFPDTKLIFLFIPFPIKAKYLLPIIVFGSVYLGYTGSNDGIAHFAHVGGAIVGFLFASYWKKNRYRIN